LHVHGHPKSLETQEGLRNISCEILTQGWFDSQHLREKGGIKPSSLLLLHTHLVRRLRTGPIQAASTAEEDCSPTQTDNSSNPSFLLTGRIRKIPAPLLS